MIVLISAIYIALNTLVYCYLVIFCEKQLMDYKDKYFKVYLEYNYKIPRWKEVVYECVIYLCATIFLSIQK